jgi:S-adenosylmethionine hydrolase
MARPITFLSDYGLADEFVGVVHGVIARLCPDARIIDLGHGVPRQDVQAGARMLERALPYTPAGVHLAVVDPEVGAGRRAVALRTQEADRLLVGPDNGLLVPAAERFGGVVEAVEISASAWRLEPVSATFHGRDVFAPAAAALATGRALDALGPPATAPVELDWVAPTREAAGGLGDVIALDRFGNATTNLPGAWADGGVVEVAGVRVPVRRTYADVGSGEAVAVVDSEGRVEIAVRDGSAARVLGVAPGMPVWLVRG